MEKYWVVKFGKCKDCDSIEDLNRVNLCGKCRQKRIDHTFRKADENLAEKIGMGIAD